jgi:hypothetical protein
MPPHCDSFDGPVVRAAQRALETGNAALVLPFVPKTAEGEVSEVFARVMTARTASAAAREVADRLFLETVVRLHRAGEGAPFTGLKPAGLDVGPVIPVAEKAVETGITGALEEVLVTAVHEELARRFRHLGHLRAGTDRGVDAARAYVEAALGLQVWAHGLYHATRAAGHGVGHAHE